MPGLDVLKMTCILKMVTLPSDTLKQGERLIPFYCFPPVAQGIKSCATCTLNLSREKQEQHDLELEM